MAEMPDLSFLPGARLIQALPGGPASRSWRIESGGRHMVLRQDRPLAAALGLDRFAEREILRHVGGLAPRVVHADPDAGILVTEWVTAHHWSVDELLTPQGLDRLGATLHRLHGLPAQGKAFDPLAIGERYARAAGSGHAAALTQLQRCVEQAPAPKAPAICHHDAHAGNLFGTDPVVLIDWEYAAVGHPLMDLAVVSRYHRLDAARTRRLLDAWSGGDGAASVDALESCVRVYDGLASLWQAAVTHHIGHGR